MHHVGVLLVHGIFGSPREFDSLEQNLRTQGYLTQKVTLPGHGVEPEKSLKHVSAQELVKHCRTVYDAFATQCDEVIIVGHSLGAICTLVFASETLPKLKGMVVFSTPYEKAYFVNYPHGFLKLDKHAVLPGLKYLPQIYTLHEKPQFLFWWFPHLYQECRKLLEMLRTGVSNINVPVTLVHSRNDLIIPYAEMEKLSKHLTGSPEVTLHTLAHCGHQIFAYSREKEQATRIILDFLAKHCETPSVIPNMSHLKTVPAGEIKLLHRLFRPKQ